MNVWVTNWYPPGNTTPQFYIQGDHFNIGSITIGIYRNNDSSPIWKINSSASKRSGFVGGGFGVQSNVIDGSGDPSVLTNAYIKVDDSISIRSSTLINVVAAPNSESTLSVVPGPLPPTSTSATTGVTATTITVATASGLGVGAKAGIGVSSVIGGLLLVGAGLFILRKR